MSTDIYLADVCNLPPPHISSTHLFHFSTTIRMSRDKGGCMEHGDGGWRSSPVIWCLSSIDTQKTLGTRSWAPHRGRIRDQARKQMKGLSLLPSTSKRTRRRLPHLLNRVRNRATGVGARRSHKIWRDLLHRRPLHSGKSEESTCKRACICAKKAVPGVRQALSFLCCRTRTRHGGGAA